VGQRSGDSHRQPEEDWSREVVLRAEEEWVLGNPSRERAVLLDQAGRVLTRKEGEPGAVLWTEEGLRPLYRRVDLITHNHARGTSLGADDLATLLFLDAREVNAITPQLRFRLARSTDAWPVEELLVAFGEERQRLVREMTSARNEGRMTDEQVELHFYHELWQRVTRRFPDRLLYAMERRR
jgi:hypothetical protein